MRKMPSAFVTAWNRKFVSGCTRLIRTLGITEPLGSVTLLVIVPVSNWASAELARPIQTSTTTPTLCNDIFPRSTPAGQLVRQPSTETDHTPCTPCHLPCQLAREHWLEITWLEEHVDRTRGIHDNT